MLKWFGYNKGEVLAFNAKRPCGLWFCVIGVVIMVATLLAGEMMINPFIFGVGYAIGFLVSFSKKVNEKLQAGVQSKFQDKMRNLAILLCLCLCL